MAVDSYVGTLLSFILWTVLGGAFTTAITALFISSFITVYYMTTEKITKKQIFRSLQCRRADLCSF